MADDPTPQPDNTEWVIVAHYKLPIPHTEVIGHYPTWADAMAGLQAATVVHTWFTTYSIEHRNKE